jgi:mRNA-degrading endonuclease toxin of MazEF toxin-antitoxin module
VDKIMTMPRARVDRVIGRLDDATMLRVNRALAVFVGMA